MKFVICKAEIFGGSGSERGPTTWLNIEYCVKHISIMPLKWVLVNLGLWYQPFFRFFGIRDNFFGFSAFGTRGRVLRLADEGHMRTRPLKTDPWGEQILVKK